MITAQATGASSIGIGFVYSLLFVLPGVIFVKLVKFGEREIDGMSRFDKLGYVLAGGVASLFFILTADLLLFESPMTFSEISSLPIVILLYVIIFQCSIAALLGYGWGRVLHQRSNPKNAKTWEDREQPWGYIIDKIRQEHVKIITEDGNELHGIVSRYGSGNDPGDLTLGSPRFVIRSKGDEQKKYSLGNEAYISSSNIAQIHYQDRQYQFDDSESPFHEEREEETEKDENTEQEGG